MKMMFFHFGSIAIKSYTIRFSVRELYADRVFLMIFMIRHKSYTCMRVTAVTLDAMVARSEGIERDGASKRQRIMQALYLLNVEKMKNSASISKDPSRKFGKCMCSDATLQWSACLFAVSKSLQQGAFSSLQMYI